MARMFKMMTILLSIARLTYSAYAQDQVENAITVEVNAESQIKGVASNVIPGGICGDPTMYDFKTKTWPKAHDCQYKGMLEDGLSIIGKINFDGAFEIIGVVRTGDSFGRETNTLFTTPLSKYRGEGSAPDPLHPSFTPDVSMNLRNIYVQKAIKQHLVQIGALQPDNGITNITGLATTGWIDGGRVKLHSKFGDVMVTGGYLSGPDQVSALGRIDNFKFNYVEIAMSTNTFKKLGIQVGAQYFEGELTYKAAVSYDLALTTDRVVKLLLEATDQDVLDMVISAGFSTDIVSLITGHTSGVILSGSYIFMANGNGSQMDPYRSQLNRCVDGSGCGVISLEVPLTKNKNLAAFAAARLEPYKSANQYEIGLSFKFGKKKKK